MSNLIDETAKQIAEATMEAKFIDSIHDILRAFAIKVVEEAVPKEERECGSCDSSYKECGCDDDVCWISVKSFLYLYWEIQPVTL